MRSLREEIESMFRAARLGRDALATETLNSLRAALRNTEIEKRETLSDEDILSALRREIKQYGEAIEALESSGAVAGAQEAAARRAVLAPLLPPELPDEEILAVVAEERSAMGDHARMGPLMGRVMKRLTGVSGQRVRALVESLLDGG